MNIPNFQGNAAVSYTDREPRGQESSSISDSGSAKTKTAMICLKLLLAANTVLSGSPVMSHIIRSMMRKMVSCINSIKCSQIKKRMSFSAAGWVSISIMIWIRLLRLRWKDSGRKTKKLTNRS